MSIKSAKNDAVANYRYAAAYVVKARAGADARHLRKAEKTFRQAREALISEASTAGKALREGLETQQRLVREVAANRIAPEQANERNRELATRLSALRVQIADINALLNAQPGAVAANAPDLPIEEYGDRVRTRPRVDLKPSRTGFIIWLLILALIGIAGVFYAGLVQLQAPVRMSVSALQPGGPFTVTVRNDGKLPTQLVVPHIGNRDGLNGQYALSVFVRNPEGEFHAIECLDCWVYMGATLNEPAQVIVAPQLSAQFNFRPARLRNWNITGDAVKFTLYGPIGEVLAEQTLNY